MLSVVFLGLSSEILCLLCHDLFCVQLDLLRCVWNCLLYCVRYYCVGLAGRMFGFWHWDGQNVGLSVLFLNGKRSSCSYNDRVWHTRWIMKYGVHQKCPYDYFTLQCWPVCGVTIRNGNSDEVYLFSYTLTSISVTFRRFGSAGHPLEWWFFFTAYNVCVLCMFVCVFN